MHPQSPTEPTHLITDTVAAVLAAGAGAAAAGPSGALIGGGSGPVLTAAMRDLVGRVQSWRARRSGEAFSLAAALAGLSEDQFAAQLAGDEQLTELAARVLVYVQDVALPNKRKALARVLGEAARTECGEDRTRLDLGLLLARAIAALDEVHIHAMAVLEPYRGFVPEPPNPNLASEEPLGATFSQVEAADQSLTGLANACIRWLISHGLAEDVVVGMTLGTERQHTFALTQFGHEVLRVLRH